MGKRGKSSSTAKVYLNSILLFCLFQFNSVTTVRAEHVSPIVSWDVTLGLLIGEDLSELIFCVQYKLFLGVAFDV